MAEHTPGPWRLCAHLADHDQCSCGYRGGIWSGDGETIVCEIGGPSGAPGDEMIPRADRQTQFADAHLIAAAPEMLEALVAALPYIETAEEDDAYKPGAVAKITRQVRAAIAKAEGQS